MKMSSENCSINAGHAASAKLDQRRRPRMRSVKPDSMQIWKADPELK